MASTKKYIINWTVCLFLMTLPVVFFQSCELEPNPTGNTVEAQVLNYDGFLMDSRNLSSFNVSIGYYPVLKPDYFGYCRFENVLTPYGLNITQGFTSYYYKELNSRNPKIVINGFDGPNTKKCTLTVRFPTIEQGKNGYVHLISKDIFKQDIGHEFLINENYNTRDLVLEIPSDQESISGKLVFMQCYYLENYYLDVLEYFNFGTKDVKLYPGLNDTIEFSQHDVEFDPEETMTNITVSYPETYSNYDMTVYLSFPGYNKNSDIEIGHYLYTYGFLTQVVPASLNLPFDIKIESNCWNYNTYWSYKYRYTEIVNVQSGQNCHIQHQKTNLSIPQNNEENITSNSILKAEDNGTKGVYVYYIGLKGDTLERGVYIYSDKNEISLNEKLNNFTLMPNTWYAWSAGKYSMFNSIDDFLSEPFVLRDNYHSFRLSDTRYFKTAP